MSTHPDAVLPRVGEDLATARVEQSVSSVEPHPDADLVIACRQIADLQRNVAAHYARCYATGGDERVVDAEVKPLEERTVHLIEQVATRRAGTVAGIQHKALALAAWNRELLKGYNDLDGGLTQSLVGDLLGIDTDDEGETATKREQIANGSFVLPAFPRGVISTPDDTPLQQLGRLIEDVENRRASYDVGGSCVSSFAFENRARLQNALHGARMGLYEAACDHRAETEADLVVQLSSAFVLIDCQASSEPTRASEDAHRVRAAIASALSVILRSVGSLAAVPLRDSAAEAVRLVFDHHSDTAEETLG